MLSIKKVLAGRGAVDYYLNQTRHGLADYYLPDTGDDEHAERKLAAPGSGWWGGGAAVLELTGEVERREFVPLYAKGVRPGGGYLGRKFRLPEQAAAAKREALLEASDIDDPYERWMARHEIRRSGGRASVAAWDCTFSPVKSVSLLWAAGDTQIQQQVWAAHTTAVDAGLGYLEEHAGYVRAGAQGVRVLDTTGLVVARMNEWTSRAGDMQLHTHCLVLNRAQSREDGKWRALDGRAVLSARTGAGAVYNRTLEAELTRRLGVVWRDRPDGLREVDGVDDDLIELFSTRRRAITARVTEMAEAYRDRYEVDPPPAVLSAMAQHATVTTRPAKRDIGADEALATWEVAAREHGRRLRALPGRVIGRTPSHHSPGTGSEGQVEAVIGRLAVSGRATFTRHDLLRAALDVLPPGDRSPSQLQETAEALVDRVLASPELLTVTTPDPIDVPEPLRRADGTSVYTQPGRHRWTLRATLDQEAWLLEVTTEPTGRHLDPTTLDQAIQTHALGVDQAAAVHELLGDDRRVGLLVGPAGAGKTRTLRAVVDAWQQTGSEVIGLTVSQSAAEVLTAEAQVRAENTAKWLYETRRGRWQLAPGTLMIVDEASMVATRDLVEIVEQTRRAGGRVLLVGDPAQLSAIHIGGAFDLLADRHGTATLHEARRFTEPWERRASLQLHDRDPAALADYAMRGRIHGGTTTDIETGLFDAWTADALTPDPSDQRPSVLMIVATNDQAAVLSERARHTLLTRGAVDDGPTVQLRDNVASVGDHIVTRRNDRRLRTSARGWVINGDVWTILTVHHDGAADARRHSDGATITLPADYLAEHCHLGYATTAHRAQGMTVDVCHAAITPDVSHQQLYVAATRGRHGNHLWVAVDADYDTVRDDHDLPAPEQLLSNILARHDPDRHAAHQAIADGQTEVASLAWLGAIFEDAGRTATDQWLTHTLTTHGLAGATSDPEWPALVARARQAALAGHDLEPLVDQALTMRPVDGAHSIAAVLHWRLDTLANTTAVVRPRGPLRSLPPIETPETDVARQAGELMRQRWRNIRHSLTQVTGPLEVAPALGARPDDPREASAWLTAATPIIAYRERYETPDYTPILGPRPPASRPDARAAWDHARLAADRYLARRLHDLDNHTLDQLDARMQERLADRPDFDPEELTVARRALDNATRARPTTRTAGPNPDTAVRTLSREVDRLEGAADAYRGWQRLAAEADDIRRQIELERTHRRAGASHAVAARRR